MERESKSPMSNTSSPVSNPDPGSVGLERRSSQNTRMIIMIVMVNSKDGKVVQNNQKKQKVQKRHKTLE